MATLRRSARRGLVTAMLALAGAGCAPTVAELRAREPDQTWESSQPPTVVIACIRDAADAASRWTDALGAALLRLDTRPDGTQQLLGTITGGLGPPTPVFDVLAEPRGRGSVVSLRAYARWPGHLRPIVTRCVGS